MRPAPAVAPLLAGLILLAAPSRLALAHEGPPFPILVDEVVGPYVAEVWTDPDIGIGTFFVILRPRSEGALVPPTSVRVAVAPVSGRLAEASYEARRERTRSGARYMAEVEFDRGEFWRVRVTIESPAGGGVLEAEVEATPAGTIGAIGLVLYALPFALIAAVWVRAALVRRRMERETREGAADPV